MKYVYCIIFLSLYSANSFTQDSIWTSIYDTVYHDVNRPDTSFRIGYPVELKICHDPKFITEYPLNEKSYWIEIPLLELDFDIARSVFMMFKIRFKCLTRDYTILQTWRGNKEVFNDKHFANELKGHFLRGNLKEKVFNFICNRN